MVILNKDTLVMVLTGKDFNKKELDEYLLNNNYCTEKLDLEDEEYKALNLYKNDIEGNIEFKDKEIEFDDFIYGLMQNTSFHEEDGNTVCCIDTHTSILMELVYLNDYKLKNKLTEKQIRNIKHAYDFMEL